MPGRAFCDEHSAAFERDGYAIVRGLLDEEEAALLQQVTQVEIGPAAGAWSRRDAAGLATRLSVRNELSEDVYSALVRSRRVVSAMERVLGGEVYHYHHKLMIKDAGGGGAWEWHQDYGYWYENGCLRPDMGSCLVAISPCTRENGCLQVVPGSHRLGRLDHARVSEQAGADPSRVAAILGRTAPVHAEMEPGDGLFFHCNTLHRSDANRSDAPRLSVIACYNTRENDPVREHHHPRYTPLEVWDDARLLEAARTQLAATPKE